MKVSGLIEALNNFDPDLDVYVRQATDYRDDGAEVDYWELSPKDIVQGDVLANRETGEERTAILIGDDRL
ncbi:hypothetical protein [Methanoregula sp.]|uniref:hypothetical protein n=1 Tax=Methanoregula sp. TaxID=2052170 RepID=UPI0035691962